MPSDPATPWLARKDWAAGRIQSSDKTAMWTTWIFALFWNAISFPIAILIVPKELAQHHYAILFALLFPAVGIGLLAWAINVTLRWIKFGGGCFEMTDIPVPLGGALTGRLLLGRGEFRPDQQFRVRLACINRVTSGTGNDRSTHDYVRWEDQADITRQFDNTLPITFYIPPDNSPTNSTRSDNQILWQLQITAELPGVDFNEQYEIPVFPVALTPEQTARATAAQAQETAALRQYQPPPESPILVHDTNDGRTEIYFPAGRNNGIAFFLGVFFIFWTGAIVLMIYKSAPIFFYLIFSIFDVLIFLWFVTVAFGTTSIVIGNGLIQITRNTLGFGGVKTIQAATISRIATKVGMTSGSTCYYDIQITTTDENTFAAGSNIQDKRHADWLAAEMLRLAAM